MKKQLTYKEIGNYIGKSENTVKGWKQKFPELLELVIAGIICKENNLSVEALDKLTELRDTLCKES